MIKYVINPKYLVYEKEFHKIPHRFDMEGRVIYEGRNLIKQFCVGDLDLNVKRYKIPNLFNRIVYTFFRLSKGKRAFIYPAKLLEAGFETPEPVAYIEEKKLGLIYYSYFISIQSPYRFDFYQFGDAQIEDCSDVVIAFAQYTARLHEAGILHHDYSPGNILFDKVEDKYHFCLVDINRMSFGEVSVEKGCANFARLWGQPAFFELLAKEYAKARGADEEYCRNKIMVARKKFWKRFSKKHEVKYKLELE